MKPKLPIHVTLDDGGVWSLDSWQEVRSTVEWLDPDEEPDILVIDAQGNPVTLKIVACEVVYAEIIRFPLVFELGMEVRIFETLASFAAEFRPQWFSEHATCMGYDADGRLTAPWPSMHQEAAGLFKQARVTTKYQPRTLEIEARHFEQLRDLVKRNFSESGLLSDTHSEKTRQWLKKLNSES